MQSRPQFETTAWVENFFPPRSQKLGSMTSTNAPYAGETPSGRAKRSKTQPTERPPLVVRRGMSVRWGW